MALSQTYTYLYGPNGEEGRFIAGQHPEGWTRNKEMEGDVLSGGCDPDLKASDPDEPVPADSDTTGAA